MIVAACLKWVDRRPEVDPVTGAVHDDDRWSGTSDADQAALEWALQLGSARGAAVVAISAGPAAAERALRDALAAGADRAVRIDTDPDAPSELVATALAAELLDLGASLVVCGDYSLDRGSGSVPAYVAGHLGVPQLLGLTAIDVEPDRLVGTRRLDGGRRERVACQGAAVLSVEGATARLRRASLAATLGAASHQIEQRPGPHRGGHVAAARPARPFRPRARALAGPSGATALDRVRALTGAGAEQRTSSSRIQPADAESAADAIVEQLRSWGYEI